LGLNMNLAAILAVGLLGLGWLPPSAPVLAAQPVKQNAAPSEPQAAPPQSQDSTPPAPAPTGQTHNSTGPAKPVAKTHHHKKTVPNCSTAPMALNPAVGNPADGTTSAGAGSTEAGSVAGSTNAAATNPDSTNAGSANTGPVALKPCPPPKKVVRNGGSSEPTVQLTGGTPAEQAIHQSSTNQLTAATEENLKKIAGRQLNPSQQEMVSQIKQFMAQSKTAVAAGNLERGHNLALKAHLLSDELVKP
jgi:hypothetical protein